MLRMALACVSNGIPFDVAMSLEPHEALGFCVIFGELNGGEFDWEAMAWVKKD